MLCYVKYDAKRNKTERTGLKILSPKQMLQRLPIALAQVKDGKVSDILLNKIRQIVYSLYQSKHITKKVCNSINKSINVLKICEKIIGLSNLSIYYTCKNKKSSRNNNKF